MADNQMMRTVSFKIMSCLPTCINVKREPWYSLTYWHQFIVDVVVFVVMVVVSCTIERSSFLTIGDIFIERVVKDPQKPPGLCLSSAVLRTNWQGLRSVLGTNLWACSLALGWVLALPLDQLLNCYQDIFWGYSWGGRAVAPIGDKVL